MLDVKKQSCIQRDLFGVRFYEKKIETMSKDRLEKFFYYIREVSGGPEKVPSYEENYSLKRSIPSLIDRVILL